MTDWTITQYALADSDRIVFATVSHYDNYPDPHDGGDWNLSIAAGRLDVDDLKGTWWETPEAAIEAVNQRTALQHTRVQR